MLDVVILVECNHLMKCYLDRDKSPSLKRQLSHIINNMYKKERHTRFALVKCMNHASGITAPVPTAATLTAFTDDDTVLHKSMDDLFKIPDHGTCATKSRGLADGLGQVLRLSDPSKLMDQSSGFRKEATKICIALSEYLRIALSTDSMAVQLGEFSDKNEGYFFIKHTCSKDANPNTFHDFTKFSFLLQFRTRNIDKYAHTFNLDCWVISMAVFARTLL